MWKRTSPHEANAKPTLSSRAASKLQQAFPAGGNIGPRTQADNLCRPAASKLTALPSSPPKQRDLAAAVDKTRLEQLTAAMQTESVRAHLRLVQQPAAGAWLAALPAESMGLHIEPALFRVLLQMRLRMPVAPHDDFCPLCDGIADKFGDHSRACPCGGDRVKRHNRLRTVLAAAAGLSPEVEKPDLLPPRPEELGACEAGGPRAASGRRPADV